MILFLIKIVWLLSLLLFCYFILSDFILYDLNIVLYVLVWVLFLKTLAYFQHTLSLLFCIAYYMWKSSPAHSMQFRNGVRISSIVLPSEISLFLQMKHHCYVDASYLALVCMFGKCGMIDYFHHSRSFALVSAHQENFFHPLWLFTIYTIHTKLVFWDNERFYFEQKFLESNQHTYYIAMIAMKTFEDTPEEIMHHMQISTENRPLLSREFLHFYAYVTGLPIVTAGTQSTVTSSLKQ